MDTPDSMTSTRIARRAKHGANPLISDSHADARFRGNSRLGVWLEEFQAFAKERSAGTGDRLPNLSVIRLPNDHTDGIGARKPTPQFYVADNDYALGLLVEAVSNSPYWKDTAIVVVEDDAQDGPDHVDAHRSVALVISAYNRPGALVHEFHNTVSLIQDDRIAARNGADEPTRRDGDANQHLSRRAGSATLQSRCFRTSRSTT